MKTPFSHKLFENYLEDASFYYDQKRYLLDQDTLFSSGLARTEERLERAIKALSMGKGSALEFCSHKLQDMGSCDAGEIFSISSLFCRAKRFDDVRGLVNSPEIIWDKEKRDAVVEALKAETLPGDWIESLFVAAKEEHHLLTLVMELCISKNIHPGDEIIGLIIEKVSAKEETVPRLLGRIEARPDHLFRLLESDDKKVRMEAAIALMRFLTSQELETLYGIFSGCDSFVIPMALSGEGRFYSEILNRAEQERSAEAILALALTGTPNIAESLLSFLDSSEVAESASRGLYLFTGARLMEKHFVPEPVDRDLLFDDELEKLDRGEDPYSGQNHPGEMKQVLSQNPRVWTSWWEINQGRFMSHLRYRLGLPLSKEVLVGMLNSSLSVWLMRLISDELFINCK